MSAGLGLAVLVCLANSCVYVGLMYVWRGNLPRDHPSTIKRRLLSTALACCLAWLPTYFWATRFHGSTIPVNHLLGLRLAGLLRAVADSLFLCVTLFIGPLVYFVHSIEIPEARAPPPRRSTSPQPNSGSGSGGSQSRDGTGGSGGGTGIGGAEGQSRSVVGRPEALPRRPIVGGPAARGSRVDASGSADGGGDSMAAALAAWLSKYGGDLRLWRNLVAAPLTEEFVFRACMVPLLKLEGVGNRRVVLLTPLLFGAAHLHHVMELVRHQRFALGRAVTLMGFQMVYTTVFGWLATYLFLRTGHLAAPVAAHVFCNWAGFPPFFDIAEHPRGILLILTTLAGVLVFGLALPGMTEPQRYQQDFYGDW